MKGDISWQAHWDLDKNSFEPRNQSLEFIIEGVSRPRSNRYGL
jgi:hypothetical protein